MRDKARFTWRSPHRINVSHSYVSIHLPVIADCLYQMTDRPNSPGMRGQHRMSTLLVRIGIFLCGHARVVLAAGALA